MKGGSLSMVRDSIPRIQEWAADPEDNEWKDGPLTYAMHIPYTAANGVIRDRRFRQLDNYGPLDGERPDELILLFYDGMTPTDDPAVLYPKLNSASPSFDLTLTGSNGLWNRKLKSFYDRTFASKRIRALFNLTPEDVIGLKSGDIISFTGDNKATINCVYESVLFTTPSGRETIVEAEATLVVLDTQLLDKVSDGRIYLKYEYIVVGNNQFHFQADIRVMFFADKGFRHRIAVTDLALQYVDEYTTIIRGKDNGTTVRNFTLMVTGNEVIIEDAALQYRTPPNPENDPTYVYKRTVFFSTKDYLVTEHAEIPQP